MTVLRDRRSLLVALAVLLALGEVQSAFTIDHPGFALAFAALFLAAALWTRRPGTGGPIMVALLCAFELAQFPTWSRHGVGDWVSQAAYAAVSLVALVLALVVVTRSVRLRRTAVS